MVVRNVIRIDEERCTGCGLCIPRCAEGALKIIDGKAKLIDDKYCDGLGACLSECPQEAIIIEEREAGKFDERAVEIHLKKERKEEAVHHTHLTHQSCPSTTARYIERNGEQKERVRIQERRRPRLSQWPVQLSLLPTNASFFRNADVLIVADCVPFAYPNFHNHFLKDRIVVVGCPKLDDVKNYQEKLCEIFKVNNIKSITVVNMEVPCCFGLFRLVREALDASGEGIPLKQETISIEGRKIPRDQPTIR